MGRSLTIGRVLARLAGRPALGMAVGTAASRATGFLRTVALASALGVGVLSDAYNSANTAPNMLFALVAGGTLSSALVPMLTRRDDVERRREDASVVLGTAVVISVLAAIGMAVAAPWIMRGLAAGAGTRPGAAELVDIGGRWLRVFAWQVPFYAISVVAVGILTAHRRLTLGAAAGVATNVVTIIAIGWFVLQSGQRPPPRSVDGAGIAILGWGTTLGVATMALIQLWGARRAVPGLRLTPRLRHRATDELRHLGGWVFLYVLVNQVSLGVVVAIASSVPGGVSAYQWAFMLMQLPYAVVAVSIFSSAFPGLVTAAADSPDLTTAVAKPARAAFHMLLPASAALAVLGSPVAALTIGEGSSLVAAALWGFSVSLIPFSLFQLLTRASYARRDSRSPALVNIAANATMLLLDALTIALPLGPRATVTGLALAHAGSYVVGCMLLFRSLRRQGAIRRLPNMLGRLSVPIAAAVLMSLVLLALPTSAGRDGRLGQLLAVAVATTVGSTVYAASLWAGTRWRAATSPQASRSE